MTNINDGGPAFPVHDNCADYHGMTLRDWFAGQVIGAIYTRSESSSDRDAKEAYAIADAMLAAREAKP